MGHSVIGRGLCSSNAPYGARRVKSSVQIYYSSYAQVYSYGLSQALGRVHAIHILIIDNVGVPEQFHSP